MGKKLSYRIAKLGEEDLGGRTVRHQKSSVGLAELNKTVLFIHMYTDMYCIRCADSSYLARRLKYIINAYYYLSAAT